MANHAWMVCSAAIVGAGAIGCHIAYCLRRASWDVCIVARGDTFEALSTHGLRITICGESHVETDLKVVASEDTSECGPVDYLILTVKMYSLDGRLLDSIKPLIGPRTTILPPTTALPYWWCHRLGGEYDGLQIRALDPDGKLWATLPPEQCLGLTYWCSAVQEAPGVVNVKHIQRGYPVGELGGDSAASPRATRFAAALRQGDVPAPVVDNIRSEIFIKAVNSMAFNVVAVLSGATNGQMADCEPSVETLRSIMAELEQLSTAMVLPLQQTAEERITQTLASRAHTMSMLHDLQQGKDLEAASLFDSLQALAGLVGVSLPLTTALVQLVELRKTVVDESLASAMEPTRTQTVRQRFHERRRVAAAVSPVASSVRSKL